MLIGRKRKITSDTDSDNTSVDDNEAQNNPSVDEAIPEDDNDSAQQTTSRNGKRTRFSSIQETDKFISRSLNIYVDTPFCRIKSVLNILFIEIHLNIISLQELVDSIFKLLFYLSCLFSREV